jgi:hypothetical protein
MFDATPLLRLYARQRLSRLRDLNPMAAQATQLARLIQRARDTRFGRDHGFARIRTIADFQAAVPLRNYDAFHAEYWQRDFPFMIDVSWPGRIPYFAASSGTTTGATKYIPVTDEMNAANRRAIFDMLSHHVAHRPQSRVLGGKNFMLGGSTELKQLAPGVQAGDLSGIAAAEVPWWASARYFPSPELALIGDWEKKTEMLAQRSLAEDIRTVGGTPSWLLLFFERLRALNPDAAGRLVDYYPALELLVYGGVNFAPYRGQFEALLAGSHAELREVYPASEGFIAVADRGPGEGLRLLLDNGLFFEFVPVEALESPAPVRHVVGEVELGINYAVVVTSCAGLWSYILGDTVRFVGRIPPRIVITGRTAHSLSAFGEHLIGEEIDDAISAAARAVHASVADYTVGAVVPARAGDVGYHLYIVEFDRILSDEDRALFASELDAKLCSRNLDYAEHRKGNYGMLAPHVMVAPQGTFAEWMKSRGKLGGQNKVPRVMRDAGQLEALIAMTERRPAS